MMNGALKGPTGKTSLMRLSTIIVVLSIMGVFIAHNIVAMIHGMPFVSLGASEALLIAGSLGIKAGQAFFENKNDKPTRGGSGDNKDNLVTPRVPQEDADKVN